MCTLTPAVAPYRSLYHSVRKSPMSRATWFFRVLGLVRLARTGVNVFMLDADCVLLHDWYRVPAAFPSVHMWTLQDHASPANVNTGTYYLRGVHRDGPVLWALYQMIEWVRTPRLCHHPCTHPWLFITSGAWNVALPQIATSAYSLDKAWSQCKPNGGAVQMAGWHDDAEWLRLAHNVLGYSIEDFEQNLVAYALLATRVGIVPQMRLDEDSGLQFRPGQDIAALQGAGLTDPSVLSLRLPRPANAAEWGNLSRWQPAPGDLGLPAQLQSADVLRRRWLARTPRTPTRQPSNATGPPSSSPPAPDSGALWWRSRSPRSRDGARPADGAAALTGSVAARAFQLVVPAGQYTRVSTAALRALTERPAGAVRASVAAVRERGKLFFAAFPPVRLCSACLSTHVCTEHCVPACKITTKRAQLAARSNYTRYATPRHVTDVCRSGEAWAGGRWHSLEKAGCLWHGSSKPPLLARRLPHSSRSMQRHVAHLSGHRLHSCSECAES